jgi:hypothetical protein
MDSSSSGSLRRHNRGGRLRRAFPPSGEHERCRRAQPAVSTGRFGGRGARFGRFGGRSTDRRARWQREGTNVKRGSAPETAYGHAVGAKLWRVQPHERIRHETRPAGSRRMEEGVERSRKPEGASGRVRQARPSKAAAASGDTLKGTKPHGRSRIVRSCPRGSGGEAAAWSSKHSVGAHKPMRGSPEWNFWTAPATEADENPGAQPIGSEGKRGALNPYGR